MVGIDPERHSAIWLPDDHALSKSNMARFAQAAGQRSGRSFATYGELWEWSTSDLAGFWSTLVEYFGVDELIGYPGPLVSGPIWSADWFPGTSLNYASYALRRSGPGTALILESEAGTGSLTHDELRESVARVARGLRELGVGFGDYVAAYAPSVRETIVAFLATVSLGAVWSVCSPDLGVRTVLDRFRQIEPKVLLASSQYTYRGRVIDRSAEIHQISAGLPSLKSLIVVGPVGNLQSDTLTSVVRWDGLISSGSYEVQVPVPFAHPLWVVYSSGTTGPPKPIVHSHGGILIEHLKLLSLHLDVNEGDRFSWYSTTGWIMWNISLGVLLSGGVPIIYDGNPGYPTLDRLWHIASKHRISHFGASPAFFDSCAKEGVRPARDHDLTNLRFIGSSGSALSADGFDWLKANVSGSALIGSMSGGTDVATAFIGPCPLLPVRPGELQAACLGVAAMTFSPESHRVIGDLGELVVAEPMPSMPVGFVGDPEGARYRASYFETFPNTWHHGDWARIYEDGGAVIYGRSDATLNRGGVRMGTSEFYRVLDRHPSISDSLIVEAPSPDGSQLLLFIVMSPGATFDANTATDLKQYIRVELSPRHVPDKIVAVRRIPRTSTGKKLEVPIKRLFGGAPANKVVDLDAVDDQSAFTDFVDLYNSWGGDTGHRGARPILET